MERCDGNSWSDEEWFLEATQRYVDGMGSPQGAVEGGVDQVSREEEVIEEFVIDDSFEEWTATFLGRASLGCGNRQTEGAVVSGAGSRTDDQGGEFGASKDNLGETLEILGRTVSMIPDNEDPSHPRVTEPEKGYSSGGVDWVRMTPGGGQDEAAASLDPDNTDQAPDRTVGPTTGQTREAKGDQF